MISLTTTLKDQQLRQELHRLQITEGDPKATGESIKNICHRYKRHPKYIQVMLPVEADNDMDAGYSYVMMNGADFLFLNFIQFQIEY